LLAVLDAFEILSNPRLRAQYDAAVAKQAKLPKLAEPPKPPPSRGVAMARAGVALLQLAYMGGLALLLLLVAIAVLIEVATGK
jgi:hypothetical protein